MAIATFTNGASANENQLTGAITRTEQVYVTGLTAAAANAIPHGLTNSLGAAASPSKVLVVPWNTSQAAAAPPTLDGTQGNAITGSTAKTGFDSTNVYVVTGAGVTACSLLLESY
jgi:hypothetical protein